MPLGPGYVCGECASRRFVMLISVISLLLLIATAFVRFSLSVILWIAYSPFHSYTDRAVVKGLPDHLWSPSFSSSSSTSSSERREGEIGEEPSEEHTIKVFGVYDGHGGWQCADFVARSLVSRLDAELRAAQRKTGAQFGTRGRKRDVDQKVRDGLVGEAQDDDGVENVFSLDVRRALTRSYERLDRVSRPWKGSEKCGRLEMYGIEGNVLCSERDPRKIQNSPRSLNGSTGVASHCVSCL